MESYKEKLIGTENLSKKVEWCQRQIELLTCPLCYGVVRQSIECAQCDTLFCRQHAQKWMGEKGSCPSCKMKPWRHKPRVHKAYQILLDKLKFDCPCGETIGYAQLERHGYWMHFQTPNGENHKQRKNRALTTFDQEDEKVDDREKNTFQPGDLATKKYSTIFKPSTSKQEREDVPTLKKINSQAPARSSENTTKFAFSYRIGDIWYLFDRSYNKKLNSALPRSKFTIGTAHDSKKFDLTGMTMSDEMMDYQLRVEPFTDQLWRCYIKQDKSYVGYPRDINNRINEQYRLNGGKGSMMIYCDRCDYLLDFERMVQINQQTHYERPISRNEY